MIGGLWASGHGSWVGLGSTLIGGLPLTGTNLGLVGSITRHPVAVVDQGDDQREGENELDQVTTSTWLGSAWNMTGWVRIAGRQSLVERLDLDHRPAFRDPVLLGLS